MRRIRVIPVLLLDKGRLVKTVRFANPNYVGDPINAVKIFNEKEVDEVILLEIAASRENVIPDFDLISKISGEAFVPMGYGGGVKTTDDIRKVLLSGFEKIILSTTAHLNKVLITQGARLCGAQSMVVCIDYKKTLFGKEKVFVRGGRESTGKSPLEFAREMADAGAGELILQSIDRDGMYTGYDLELLEKVASAVKIPIVACGGASSVKDFAKAVGAGASAVAAGSLFVYKSAARGILINYPTVEELTSELYNLV